VISVNFDNVMIRTGHLPRRLISSFNSPKTEKLKSTYYVHILNDLEMYILLLPRPSLPMGRITIPGLRPLNPGVNTVASVTSIDPLKEESIQQYGTSFIENAGFKQILQQVVKENIANEQAVVNDAQALPGGEGWVHLCDERALPPCVSTLLLAKTRFGRIPDPEHIIGSVLVKARKIIPETYQPMPTYRLVTNQGPMRLSAFLLEKLRERVAMESN
jgi:hypothetical protein